MLESIVELHRWLERPPSINVSGFRLKLLQLALLLKRSQMDSKLSLTRMNQFCGFYRWISCLLTIICPWTHICVNCSSEFLLWRHRTFSINSSRRFLVRSVKVPVRFRYIVFYIDCWAWSMPFNFTSYVFWVFQPIFLHVLRDNVDYFSRPISALLILFVFQVFFSFHSNFCDL